MAVTTVYTYPLDGSKKDFTVPFEYLARKFVAVTLVGSAGRKVLVLNTDYRFTSKTTIQTTQAWAPGSGYTTIEVKRNTSATDRLVTFADGSILRATDMTLSQVQTMHVAEEARNAVSDTISVNGDGMLDARGRRLVNLQSAQVGTDAVTYQQVLDWSSSALNSANAAAQSAQAASVSQNAANNSALSAQGDALKSQAAQLASERASNTSGAQATISLNKANESANSAAASAASAQAAAASQNAANNSAISAQSDAARAKSEADKLANTNAFAATLSSVSSSTGWIDWKTPWGLRFDNASFDTIQGRSKDLVTVLSATLGIRDLDASGRLKGGSVFVPSDANGNGHILNNTGITGVGATGFCWVSGSGWTQKGLPYFNIQATDASQNLHFWARGVNFEDRGLIYNEPDGKWVIRTAGQKTIVLYNDGSTYIPGRLQTPGQVWSQRVNPGLDGNTYGNTNFQAEAQNGSVPGYGFHRSGYEAAALVYYSGNLRMRRNDNNEYEIVHHASLLGWIANTMRCDSIGCIASMQNVSGSTIGANGTLGGGSLRYSTHNSPSGQAGAGTWLTFGVSNNGGVSNWLRIS